VPKKRGPKPKVIEESKNLVIIDIESIEPLAAEQEPMMNMQVDDAERLDQMYYDQDYTEDQELRLDEFEAAEELVEIQEIDGQGTQSMDLISLKIKKKSATLKRIDFTNIIFPYSRIEQALSSNLVELRLNSCKIISQECLGIAKSPKLAQLRALDLSCNPIKLAGLIHLLDPTLSKLDNLKRLDIYYCSIQGS